MAKYSHELKKKVFDAYLNGEGGYVFLAKAYDIAACSNIKKWVNDFRIAGPDSLRPKKKGRKNSLKSNNKKNPKLLPADGMNSTPLVDTTTEHVKQLEDELLKLRIENAYLKELRRMRLEEETLLKKQRESSTVSEDNSN